MQEFNQDYLYLISAPVFLLLSLVVSFRRRSLNRTAGAYMMVYYWSFFLAVLITYVVLSPLVQRFPHLFRTGHIFFHLVIASSFLYFRETLFPGRRSWRDLLLLLPLLLFLVDYTPFFLQSGEKKLAVLHSLDQQGVKISFAEGWFMPVGGHNLVKYLFALGCWLAQGWMIMKASRMASLETGRDFIYHRHWLTWMQFSELLIFLPSMLAMVFGRQDILTLIANGSGILAGVIQGIYLIMHPQVLYGLPEEMSEVPPTDSLSAEPAPGERPINEAGPGGAELPAYAEQLDEGTLDLIASALDHVMREKKLYLDPNLKIADLAMSTGFLSHKLSAYFRKRCDGSFYDYVNALRVNACVERLRSGDYQVKTLEALSQESGFQSRSTFIRAFKKVQGITPRDFVQGIKD